jgi:hypothetical protein
MGTHLTKENCDFSRWLYEQGRSIARDPRRLNLDYFLCCPEKVYPYYETADTPDLEYVRSIVHDKIIRFKHLHDRFFSLRDCCGLPYRGADFVGKKAMKYLLDIVHEMYVTQYLLYLAVFELWGRTVATEMGWDWAFYGFDPGKDEQTIHTKSLIVTAGKCQFKAVVYYKTIGNRLVSFHLDQPETITNRRAKGATDVI